MRSDLYEVVAPRRDKSCGRVAGKFRLRVWTINLRAWIFGFACLVFKTTYIDRRIPLREGTFFFTRTMLFPPLNKRNTRDKARGVRITSAKYIGELGARCLSTIHRERDSAATVSHRSARWPIQVALPPSIEGDKSLIWSIGSPRQQGGTPPFLWSEQTAENKHTEMNSVQLPFSFFIPR